jgi:hypothetical protein
MTSLPPEVVNAVQGLPVIGSLEPALAFLTVNDKGTVDVCLLSRAEVASAGDRVRVVLASRRARRNLAAGRSATLVVVTGNVAYYLTLRAERVIEEPEVTAAELSVVESLADDLGIELSPMRYRVEEQLVVTEHWDRSGRLLDLLGGEAS